MYFCMHTLVWDKNSHSASMDEPSGTRADLDQKAIPSLC